MGDINSTKQAYSIRKSKTSKEYHVFFANGNFESCVSETKSICDKLQKSDSEALSSCLTKSQVRHKAAPIGDYVCGICMKSMYKTI